ncbi:hypothetical protein SERLA73DRAFT_79464 [Serpula lacrymans var. lacrymans S7.3]|uniref:BTB domain-containing protein n=2 Tax=Serpula lacrymans var. lacrymans TaxID=341189 RepID=F8QGI2_SERL3|nr:hypothetical protein SERLA73DRAFT_79464 [Serpula lacrymans var. lacrymans S7.3]
MSTRDEIVDLSESSEVLELLFQYMYPQRQPSLSGLQFSLLDSLANTAEKYQVYSALEICKVHMTWATQKSSRSARVDEGPIKVLLYAGRHGYQDVCDVAAPKSLGCSLQQGQQTLNLQLFAAWMVYRDKIMPILRDVTEPTVLHRGGLPSCALWNEFYPTFIKKFIGQPDNVLRFSEFVASSKSKLSECSWCINRIERWEVSVASHISKIKFSSSL